MRGVNSAKHIQAQACFENMPPRHFWSLADVYPDSVTRIRMHTKVRLMGNLSIHGSVPWLKDNEGTLCFIYKDDIENLDHFLLDCPQFKDNFDSIWRNLELKIIRSNPTDGIQTANII